MKCQSKISVSKSNTIGGVDQILIEGNMYECELAPTMYDPTTLKAARASYIVTCEDDKFRRYYVEHFRDIVEMRSEKLKELGIE